MASRAPVKIIIADDHQMFADAMEKLLNHDAKHYQVVGKVYNGKQLIEKVDLIRPDLLLVDISMPLVNGMNAAQQIKKHHPYIKVIFISMDSSPYLRTQLKQYDFEGFVPKNKPIEQLKEAIDKVMNGEKVFIDIFEKSQGSPANNEPLPYINLSARQTEIIRLIKEGKTTNKELASHLSISVLTIETHLKNIFQLLNIKNKVELINYTFDNEAGV